MQINCPRGCTRKGKPIPINSLRGWKRHMTAKHGGWENPEMDSAMLSAGTATPGEGEQVPGVEADFSSFANDLPDSENGAPATASPAGPTDQAAPPPATFSKVKTDAASQRLTKKMEKVKRQLAEALPRAVDVFTADKGPEWKLDDSQRDMLTDAVESVFDMLDVSFEIQQFNVQLRSRFWIFLYPLTVLIMIFATKAARAPKQETEPEQVAA